MKLNNKKLLSSFELLLMTISIFAVSYLIHESDVFFDEGKYYSKDKKSFNVFEKIAFSLIKKIKAPVFSLVSAVGNDGCCSLANDGTQCVTSSPENCADGASFSEYTLCESTTFCNRGCCYDEASGVYDEGVIQSECNLDWTPDPSCNLPGANKGCCVMEDSVRFETYGQCLISSEEYGIGEVDWRNDLGEAECIVLPYLQEKGACVLNGGDCKFVTNEDCNGLGGDFNLNVLCTSSSLDTFCEPTEETACIDGKYGVFFVDSCGNTANIYDSSKVNDLSYWNNVISEGDSCGENSQTGNANSKSCGNCNLFAGGICSSAFKDGFAPDYGDNYCREVSCEFEGAEYENGESWCVYDGAIGNGDDVVGSRHWKYVCNQGRIDVEACQDYRNDVCLQSNTEVNGDIVFRNANCAVNNWRQCVALNTEEDGIEQCEDTIGCRIERVEIGEQFKFDACTPKYPAGFDLREDRSQGTSLMTCGLATQTCTVVREPKFFGGCKINTNGDCLSPEFGEKMNNLCRKLGDCGGEANIAGKFERNYKIRGAPDLDSMYVGLLKALANPVEGQYAEVDEAYGDYLEAMGLIGGVGEGDNALINSLSATSLGIGGIAYATEVGMLINIVGWSGLHTGLITIPAASVGSVLPFASAALGAAIGFQVGLYIAGQLGLSPVGTLMMSVGGSFVGATLGLKLLGNAIFEGLTLWFFWIGIGLMLLSLFFGGSDCDPIEVEFECKVWQPPRGGDDCELCNGDPLKPCSKYRCQSLGATCEFIDYGQEADSYDICYDAGVNDVNPPLISPQLGAISSTEMYSDITNNGFSIASLDGGCVEANNPLTFGISTDELAICRFSLEEKTFDEMDFDISNNFFLYNHTTNFMVPDLSHGQSQGTAWSGELDLYVKCQDPNGHETPNFYVIEMCANQGQDVTPPRILATNPVSNSMVSFDSTQKEVKIITNELSTCRWSETPNKDYYSMTNQMSCNDIFGHPSSIFGYGCSANLSVSEGTTTNYIRCADQPWYEGTVNESMRNPNTEDTPYTLKKPEKKIEIYGIQPFNDIEVVTEFASVDLKVQTSGGGEYHQCYYSFSGYENMIEFYETGITKTHVQPLNLPANEYEIFVWCKDETRDSAEGSTSFEIIYDDSIPIVSRIWNSLGKTYIITDSTAECRYSANSCNFGFGAGELMTKIGNTHSLNSVSGKEYFVKCKDVNGNIPNGCSVNFVAV